MSISTDMTGILSNSLFQIDFYAYSVLSSKNDPPFNPTHLKMLPTPDAIAMSDRNMLKPTKDPCNGMSSLHTYKRNLKERHNRK